MPRTVSGLTVSPLNTLTETATVAFSGGGIIIERVTLVVTAAVKNDMGQALDGETGDPRDPTLPTDDDTTGGAAAFQFTVLPADTPPETEVDADGCPIEETASTAPTASGCGAGAAPCGALGLVSMCLMLLGLGRMKVGLSRARRYRT